MKFRRTPYLKTGRFRRKLVKIGENLRFCASGRVHLVRPDASGRVRWTLWTWWTWWTLWCKGTHRGATFPDFCGLGELVHLGTLWLLFLSRWGIFLHRRARNRTPYGRVRLRPHFLRPDASSGRVRTRPIWRVRLPKRCEGFAPQPPSRPVVVQRHAPCNFSTVCCGLCELCGLCGAKAHTAAQLSPSFGSREARARCSG